MMKTHDTFKSIWKHKKNDEEYLTEKSIIDFTTELYQLMKNRRITQKELANKLNTSEAYVTKIFRGNANFTIATMVKLSSALGGKLSLHVTPVEENIVRWHRVVSNHNEQLDREIQRWVVRIKENTAAQSNTEKAPEEAIG